ncbi:hypothetical protein MHI39_06000 [Heyndrickxia sp. FSL K6-6286]|uniref:hypothetical protein n=1 Tax=Heyndrickxia sp. FSL K6-6286 TaxID=2921510 RepID=UPI00217E5CAE|nr:hypothetical protein [Heyndrickxia oleronia]
MLYINGKLLTGDKNQQNRVDLVNQYLSENDEVIIDKNGNYLNNYEITQVLLEEVVNIKTVKSSSLAVNFISDLEKYVNKVENYIEDVREKEEYHSLSVNFVDTMESFIEISKIQKYYHVSIVNEKFFDMLLAKAEERMKEGNLEYLLDLLEYEVLPKLEELLAAIKEENSNGLPYH